MEPDAIWWQLSDPLSDGTFSDRHSSLWISVVASSVRFAISYLFEYCPSYQLTNTLLYDFSYDRYENDWWRNCCSVWCPFKSIRNCRMLFRDEENLRCGVVWCGVVWCGVVLFCVLLCCVVCRTVSSFIPLIHPFYNSCISYYCRLFYFTILFYTLLVTYHFSF